MTLHHRIDGPDGAPVLVLGSSLGTSLEMWEPQVAPLAGALRLLDVVVDDAAHLANVEQPDRVTEALLAHFTGQEAR